MDVDAQAAQTTSQAQPADIGYRISFGWLRGARVVWVILALVGVGFLLTSFPGYGLMLSGDATAHGYEGLAGLAYRLSRILGVAASLTAALLSLGLSGFLFSKRFENPAAMSISFYLLIYSTIQSGVMEAWGIYWVGSTDFVITLQGFLLGTPTIALLALFPNGRFVPRWMRWVLLVSVPYNLVLFWFYPIDSLYAVPMVLVILFSIWMLMLPVLGIYAQIYRFRKVSTPDERHQTKWVLYGLALWFVYILFSTPIYFYLTSLPSGTPYPWWGPFSETGWWLSLCILPVSFWLAVTRYRLWNIDIVINRTLVYVSLTVLTIGFYTLAVGYLGSLLQGVDRTMVAFLATGVIAVLFQPLRERLQRGVNRMMYGNRDDPVVVLSDLGEQLERTGSPDDALSEIVETVARTLKLPYAAIELGDQVTAYGVQKTDVIRLPLRDQAELVGYLIAGQRAVGESFSSADMQLLRSIAHHAGAAAHAVKLTTDLRQSRLKLITIREEERRRIRRDLHDDLGPTLASMTLKLDAVRNVLQESPEKADQLIMELKEQTTETIQGIRNLVYELRPPALDELGLVGAIQNFIAMNLDDKLEIQFETPEQLPPLTAAQEVAVYRTVLEGLTNIIRHARAKSAEVRLVVSRDDLVIEISDDGIGMGEGGTPGVGLVAMKERSDELGGGLNILPKSTGTHIQVHFPVFKEHIE